MATGDFRMLSYLNEDEMSYILKPIERAKATIQEDVDPATIANTFYKFDNVSDLNEKDIEGVSKLEDIDIEDMEIDDKIELARKLLTNIFDSRQANNNLFIDSFIEFRKLSERYIYAIDPDWVDEDAQTQEENQPPEFEEALQNLNNPEEESVTPEEENTAPEEQPGADQEVENPENKSSEEDLINNAFA